MIMSVGNPKKNMFSKDTLKSIKVTKSAEAALNDIARVHKDKNYKVKKELSFETNNNKSKLV